MRESIRFLWNATRGYRLHPWNSPFLRWRIETYSGMEAGHLTRGLVLRFLWQQKRQLLSFLVWTSDMRAYRTLGEPGRR